MAAPLVRYTQRAVPRPLMIGELWAGHTPHRQRFGHRYASGQCAIHHPPAGAVNAVGDHDLIARHGGIHAVLDVRGGGGPVGVGGSGVGAVHVHVMHAGQGALPQKNTKSHVLLFVRSPFPRMPPVQSDPVALCSLRAPNASGTPPLMVVNCAPLTLLISAVCPPFTGW